MKKIKDLSAKICLFRLNLWRSAVFLLVMSLALTLFLFLLQPLPFYDVMVATLRSRGLNLLLNWLPVMFAMFFLYFAGAGAASAATIVGAVAIGLGFANRVKILLRGDPLVPWDLLLGGEVAGILHSFEASMILAVIAVALLYILLAILAANVIRSEKINWKIRVGGALACILIPVLLNAPLYSNHAVTARLYIRGNIWNQVNQFNSRGFVFSFINAFNTNRVMRPDGYAPDVIREIIAQADTSGLFRHGNATHPHIIMIMGEAFSDLSENPHFDFTGFPDPLENWHYLTREGIGGNIIVPVLGGGTAQTEFDVLTGLSSRQFAGVPFAFRMITDDFESMATILRRLGYRAEFMHPGFGWFYNRQNVYRHLGFERLMFSDEFESIPTKGGYINEHDTITRIVEMFAAHRENFPGVPYFNFTVTIQNHGPYVDKYLAYGVDAPNFATDLPLSDADINALSNYFYGQAEADRELRRLAEYLRALDEPVVLIYFGDHKPALHSRIYDAILPDIHEPGSFEDLTRLFRLPFLIWFNDAALELHDLQHAADLTDDEELFFSASFFGAYVLEILGFTNISPFWDFNAELRRKFPVVTETRSFAVCRTVSLEKSDEERAPLLLYRNWSYFRIFDER